MFLFCVVWLSPSHCLGRSLRCRLGDVTPGLRQPGGKLPPVIQPILNRPDRSAGAGCGPAADPRLLPACGRGEQSEGSDRRRYAVVVNMLIAEQLAQLIARLLGA